ncbi:MAG: 50S ribosomal protein L13, partial [Planctomycetia bacterium]
MKTMVLKASALPPAEWFLIDATDLVVGRMAVEIARMLMGKHRPDYTPHVLSSAFVVVVNAEKVKFTGRKWEQKEYARYTGYSSGRRVLTAEQMRDKSPETIVKLAVRRMLPKNKLAYTMLTQLKIFAGP